MTRIFKHILVVAVLLCATMGYAQTYQILFDNSKAQTAGNADWKIDDNEPTPNPTSPTAESDWVGGISSWGYDLWQGGHYVITQLPAGSTITYGDTGNPQDLANFDVFVSVEPNVQFTAAEKTAIINFVNDGHGLFIVADHNGSDRNNDGIDSPAVWNDLFNNNSFGISNIFGVTFNQDSISASYTDIRALADRTQPEDTALFAGPYGSVTGIAYHAGSAMTVNTSANSNARGQIWEGASHADSEVVVATSRYGSGRIAFVGDSSPCDDGTGDPGDTLYDGWNEVGVTDREVFLNLTDWLAGGGGGSGITIGQPTLDPDPAQSNTVETVDVDITDDGSITGAVLEYRKFNDSSWTSVTMTNTTGDTWEGDIPGNDNTVIQYRITATDNDTNTATSGTYSYQVGSVPICDLRGNDSNGNNLYTGITVKVSGTVTAPTLNCFSTAGQTDIYIQGTDGCGINVYNNGSDQPQVNVGDTVDVTGALTQYKGKVELVVGGSGTSMTKTGSTTAPAETVITCSQVGEAYEGVLVRINNVTVTSGTIPASGSSGPVTIQDATGSTTMYIDKDGSIDGTSTPAGSFDLIGILSQFDDTSPYDSGYQVYPRFTTDLITGTGTTYTLTTDVASGTGTVDPSGANVYADGAVVNVTATAGSGYTFDHWTGDASGSTNPLPVTMDGNKTIHANFVVSGSGGGAITDLFISEYVEGSSNNKALEFFNGTGSSIDLAAETYTVELYANGASSPTSTISLTGTVADGDAFVLVNSSAGATLLAMADQTSGSVSFNGDDALVLKHNGTVVDSFGQVGTDPGSYWGDATNNTLNHTLRRKATVHQGDTTVDDAFDPSVEWDFYAEDTFDGLGSQTVTFTLTTAVADGSGSVDPTGTTTQNYGETVNITATADTGYTFDHWDGDASGTDNPVSVTINKDMTVNAYFTAESTAVSGIYFSEYVEGGGTNKALEIFNETGASIDLGAENYIIEIYNNGGTSPTNTLALTGTIADGDAFVAADPALAAYADQTSSSVSFNGNDAIVLKKGGASGTVVDSIGRVGENPAAGYWGDATNNTLNHTLRRKSTIHTGDIIVDDAFDPSVEWDFYAQDTLDDLGSHIATYTLTTDVAAGSGTVSPSGATSQDYGTSVDITATPAGGYVFDSWSGDATGSANPVSVTISGDMTVHATFTTVPTYTLTYTAGAGGSITGTSPQTVDSGADGSAVTAVPDTGYHFVDWSDSSTDNPRTDTNVTADINVTANFAVNTATSPLTLNEFLSDPYGAGDANGDGVEDGTQDEFVELVNNSCSGLDIGNFEIWDASSKRFTFPAGTIVPPYEAVIVFAGGTPTGTFGNCMANSLVFVTTDGGGSGILGLGNTSDSIIVKNSSAAEIIHYDYSGIAANTSQTRNPDVTGAFVAHNSVNASNYSPGTLVDGNSFTTPPVANNDIDNDGHSDVIWGNDNTGNLSIWFGASSGYSGFLDLDPISDTDFHIQGTGDFNGDGNTDILWWNQTTGDLLVWHMNGSGKIDEQSIGNITDTTWEIIGPADFNGDGTADIFWHNTVSGQMSIWYMDASGHNGSQYIGTVSDLSYQIATFGDYNGDGISDIIWQNNTSGVLFAWYFNASGYSGSSYLGTVSDINWQIEGSGDYNGDGYCDILWRNQSTGVISAWRMNQTGYCSADYIGTINDTNWQIFGRGDFNGDGHYDIIWRNISSGALFFWYMDAVGHNGSTYIGTVADANWMIKNR